MRKEKDSAILQFNKGGIHRRAKWEILAILVGKDLFQYANDKICKNIFFWNGMEGGYYKLSLDETQIKTKCIVALTFLESYNVSHIIFGSYCQEDETWIGPRKIDFLVVFKPSQTNGNGIFSISYGYHSMN